jgi:hypothetical protein
MLHRKKFKEYKMAKRLGAKHKITARDKARAYKEGTTPKKHKVAVERSRKARLKNAYRAI